MRVGLGSGTTASELLRALAVRWREEGLRFVGVATSERTSSLARELGLELTDLEAQPELDVAIDGADEVDPARNLVKGGGGALLREKIVALAARRRIIVVDDSKLVSRLGEHFRLPVEVVPFGWRVTAERIRALGLVPQLRQAGQAPFVTDSGHWILDCVIQPATDVVEVSRAVKGVVGVVEHGLFPGSWVDELIVGSPDGSVRARTR